jgi:cell division protein FtsZ
VQGITDLITTPGLINLDFADVKSVMSGAGSALMGIGSARGDDRSVAAAEMAISSPLLEASIDGAHGVLLSIQGGSDLGLFEINEAAQLVSNSAAPEANIIFGAVIDDALGDEVRVTVIAAGFGEANNPRARPAKLATGQGTGDAAFRTGPFPASPGPAADPGEVTGPGEVAGPPAEAAAVSPAATDAGPATPHSAVTAGRAIAAAAASRAAAPGPRAADGNGAPAPRAAGTNGGPPTRSGDADGGPPPRAPEPSRPRPDTASAARVFDAATTRRRSVVFEEDDELDVPDFLK